MKKLLIFLFLTCGYLHFSHAQSWISLLRKADQQKAETHWKNAASLYTQVIDSTSDKTALLECLQHRASCYKHLDQYDLSQIDYEKALDLATDSATKAMVSYNMSDLLIQTGQYERAINLLTSFRFAQSDQEYRRIANLATTYAYTKRCDQALKLLNNTIKHYSVHDNTYSLLLQNRGFILWEIKDYVHALEDLQTALPHLNGSIYYITLANVALVEAELGLFDRALQHIQEVISWQAHAPNIGSHHSIYIISLRKKAEILMKAKRIKEASIAYKSFFAAEKEYVLFNFTKMTEQARLDFWQKENPLVSEIFSLKDGATDFLYDVALYRRNMALLGSRTACQSTLLNSLLSHNHTFVAKNIQQKEATIEFVCYQDFNTGDSLYAALICTKTGTKYIDITSKKALHDYQIANKSLQHAICIGARYAQYIYTDTTLASKIWRPICNALPAHIKRIYFAPEGIFQMLGIEYLPYPPLAKYDIQRVSVTDRIHSPITPFSGKTLIIGGLNYDEINKQEDKSLNTIGNNTAYNTAIRLCGGRLSFRNLPATAIEIDTLAHIMNSTSTRTSWEEDIKKNIHQYHIIHLATHGYSLRVSFGTPSIFMRDSLRHDNSLWACGIALSGANTEGENHHKEDGLLSAREICDIDLSHANLVTLSACQTAQGIVSDEGPAGILRALKKAGAGTIIATLWAVNDQSTMLFMKAFYHAWHTEKKEIHTAFRQAQKALQQYSIPQVERKIASLTRRGQNNNQANRIYPYKSPQYWAPFILID